VRKREVKYDPTFLTYRMVPPLSDSRKKMGGEGLGEQTGIQVGHVHLKMSCRQPSKDVRHTVGSARGPETQEFQI
jgi:hypothetical protein